MRATIVFALILAACLSIQAAPARTKWVPKQYRQSKTAKSVAAAPAAEVKADEPEVKAAAESEVKAATEPEVKAAAESEVKVAAEPEVKAAAESEVKAAEPAVKAAEEAASQDPNVPLVITAVMTGESVPADAAAAAPKAENAPVLIASAPVVQPANQDNQAAEATTDSTAVESS